MISPLDLNEVNLTPQEESQLVQMLLDLDLDDFDAVTRFVQIFK